MKIDVDRVLSLALLISLIAAGAAGVLYIFSRNYYTVGGFMVGLVILGITAGIKERIKDIREEKGKAAAAESVRKEFRDWIVLVAAIVLLFLIFVSLHAAGMK